ncbi:MAG: alpha/beta fold hydrolase [Porticoccaceae bacterium]|nr:alpha/beta fold hydrolase [Porticoccaceae bacterium]
MKLNYTEQGLGAAVVLMHGMFGSLSNLGNLAKLLAQSYRVISVDLRNHGDSPHEDDMDLVVMAADIVELISDLDLASATFIGHSLGGKIAMQVALNNPQLVERLVVADIAPVDYPQTNNAPALDALAALSGIQLASRRVADEVMSQHIPDQMVRAFLLKNLARSADGQFRLKLNMDSIGKNYGTSLVAAPTGIPFAGPTLFLKGETSAYIQEKHRPLIAELFPNAQLQVIGGVGHWLHAEKPDTFNNLVSSFLVANH